MLKGETITLRPVRQADLDTLRELDLDLDSRGDYWPLSITSEPAYRQEFEHTGFWGENFGRLLMEDGAGQIIGEIVYFKTVQYMDELEIGYRLFGKEYWGKGATSEALQLLTRYLFRSRNINRIRLCIDVETPAPSGWRKSAATDTKVRCVAACSTAADTTIWSCTRRRGSTLRKSADLATPPDRAAAPR